MDIQVVVKLSVHAVKSHPEGHGHLQPADCDVCEAGVVYLHTDMGRAEWAAYRAIAPRAVLV